MDRSSWPGTFLGQDQHRPEEERTRVPRIAGVPNPRHRGAAASSDPSSLPGSFALLKRCNEKFPEPGDPGDGIPPLDEALLPFHP
jgi:hypothetical protein